MSVWAYYIDPLQNDFRIVNGDFLIARGADAVQQQVLVALRTELGEWFLDTNTGIPYYSSVKTLNDNNNSGILGGSFSAAEISGIIQLAIYNVPGVISIQTFDIFEDLTNPRGFTITSSIIVETGEINAVGTPTRSTINVSL